MRNKKVTVFGGGTGSFITLSGLKSYSIDLASIVTMMDSGGSTGRLRDQLGVLPPGDFRQCLVAMSEAPILWRKLFLYRFDKGDFKGHNFGNILLSALEKITSNYKDVVKAANYILKIKGQVIPITFDKVHLYAHYQSGKIIKTEADIEKYLTTTDRIDHVYLKPKAKANLLAVKRIKQSDFLIFGPGDLFTSIIPILLVKNIKESIVSSKAKLIYIMNLMTKLGQTTFYTAMDHIKTLEKYLSRKIDIVVINNGKISEDVIKWYLANKEKLVLNDIELSTKRKVISLDLIDRIKYKKDDSDRLDRSLVRHDQKKLGKLLSEIIL